MHTHTLSRSLSHTQRLRELEKTDFSPQIMCGLESVYSADESELAHSLMTQRVKGQCLGALLFLNILKVRSHVYRLSSFIANMNNLRFSCAKTYCDWTPIRSASSVNLHSPHNPIWFKGWRFDYKTILDASWCILYFMFLIHKYKRSNLNSICPLNVLLNTCFRETRITLKPVSFF